MSDAFAAAASGQLSDGVITASAILLLLGAMGKSAQFPFHVWLPDAMEGPTPVSALIHAATMVIAGVYLVARAYPIFAASPEALMVVASIGLVTALGAATIALVSTDLKRILAYSTVSHLGLMMLSLGALGWTAAVFHLMAHGFAKALLFLGAGSVMHGVGAHGDVDIRRVGGLRRRHAPDRGGLFHRRAVPGWHPHTLRLLEQGRNPARRFPQLARDFHQS